MTNANQIAGRLEAWLEQPINRKTLAEARAAFDELAALLAVQPTMRDQLAPSLLNVFLRTGYVKDYKLLKRFARRVNRPELLREVAPVVRSELPDIWVIEALDRGDVDEAVECWFEHEAHPRARLAAPAVTKAFPERLDIIVSGRLSVANYWIGRGGRYRYRKAIRELQRLHRELARMDELTTWPLVLEDLVAQHGHRPAFIDEMKKAGVLSD